MIYNIYENEELINSIVADEEFIKKYCEDNNYTYAIFEMPEPEDEPQELTQLDRIEAQVTYTAMMTDTLLEEKKTDEREDYEMVPPTMDS